MINVMDAPEQFPQDLTLPLLHGRQGDTLPDHPAGARPPAIVQGSLYPGLLCDPVPSTLYRCVHPRKGRTIPERLNLQASEHVRRLGIEGNIPILAALGLDEMYPCSIEVHPVPRQP
jgi:hypothetical protein